MLSKTAVFLSAIYMLMLTTSCQTGVVQTDTTYTEKEMNSPSVAAETQTAHLTGHVESVAVYSVVLRCDDGKVYSFSMDENTEISLPDDSLEGEFVRVTFNGSADNVPYALSIEGGQM